MPPVRTKKIVFKLHPDVVDALRALVAQNPPLTLSGFAQDAIVMRMRSYQPATEFIQEGRDQRGRKAHGALDPSLDRADGVPLPYAADWPEAGWKAHWNMSSEAAVLGLLNGMRELLGRDLVNPREWRAIMKYMGCAPNRRVEVEDD